MSIEAKLFDAQVCWLVESVGGAPLVVPGTAKVRREQVKSDARIHGRNSCKPLLDECIFEFIRQL